MATPRPPADQTLTADELLHAIPVDLRQFFETTYTQEQLKRGVNTDPEELPFVEELLRDARDHGAFPTPAGWSQLDPQSAVPPASKAAIRARRSSTGPAGATDVKKNALRWGIILVVGIAGLFLLNWLTSRKDAPPPPPPTFTPVLAQPLTATVVVSGTPGVTLPVPTPQAVNIESIFGEEPIPFPFFYPKTLELAGGVTYLIIPTAAPATGSWLIRPETMAASWLQGSVVNYVFGLPYNDYNAAVVAGLLPGSRVLIRMSTGQILEYTIQETKRVGRQEVEYFRQTSPGVTIVLTSDPTAETRILVRGDYNPALEASSGYVSSVLGNVPLPVWNRALAGGLAVELAAVQYYTSTNPAVYGNIPGGQALYLFTMRLENIGGTPLSLTSLQVEMLDASNLRYPPLAVLARRYIPQVTPLPDWTADLSPGQTITASVAYIVPEGMLANVSLVISSPTGEEAVYAVAPDRLQPPPTATPAPTPLPTQEAFSTTLTTAIIAQEVGGVTPTNALFLVLPLTLTNASSGPIQVRAEDFVLTNADGTEVYPLAQLLQFGTVLVNIFPLGVPAQQEVGITVVFDVPDVAEVRLHAGGQVFPIALK